MTMKTNLYKWFLCFLVMALSFSGCTNQYKNVDLSDIEEMTVFNENPRLIYVDEDKTIMVAAEFGVIVFDLKEKTVTDRIPAKELFKLLAGGPMDVRASESGNEIYMGMDDIESVDPHYLYKYNIKTGKLSKTDKSVTETATFKTKYPEGLEQYFDNDYSSSETVAELEGSFAYLRISKDWQMKNLQLVICPYDVKENTVIDIFK